jgi:hypothetical protein
MRQGFQASYSENLKGYVCQGLTSSLRLQKTVHDRKMPWLLIKVKAFCKNSILTKD